MSALVWKLLRQHISIGQLTGFFLANLFGMMIVLRSEKAIVYQNDRGFHPFSV